MTFHNGVGVLALTLLAGEITVFVLLVALTGLLIYRLSVLRRGGTSVLVRTLPARADRGWHHGLVRYHDDSLAFFRLSSLRVGPDLRMPRGGIEINSRRQPVGTEYQLMSDDTTVLTLGDEHRTVEVAFERGAFTAFMSWLESRPSGRSLRSRPY